MNGYKLALYGLYILNLGVAIALHGKPREDKYNAVSTFIAAILCGTLLYFA